MQVTAAEAVKMHLNSLKTPEKMSHLISRCGGAFKYTVTHSKSVSQSEIKHRMPQNWCNWFKLTA